MTVKPIPDGYHAVTPYLVIKGVPALLDFMEQAFDAVEIERSEHPEGGILHAQAKIGDSIVMMGEPRGDFKAMPAALYLYVTDTDTTYKRALQAGATSVMEPADQFYGDRNAGVKDPVGYMWWIATHIEDVSPEEIAKRFQAMGEQHAEG